MKFEVNQEVKCINNQCLKGNDYAPSLKIGEKYKIKEIIVDSKDNQHLDVGIPSNLTFVRSWETKENLDRGDKIHWCHPSRFELI